MTAGPNSSEPGSPEPTPPWGPIRMETIQAVCDEIAARFQPEKIILFGSQAYGTPRWDSDVDLLIIMDFEGRALLQSVKIGSEIDYPFPVDIRVVHSKDVQWRYEEFDPFIRVAIDDGKIMYERDSQQVA